MNIKVKVAPGGWVTLPVPAGTQSAQIAFGGEWPAAAFIENLPGRRGGVETYAKRRCPNLRAGVHKVRVITADSVAETSIQVL